MQVLIHLLNAVVGLCIIRYLPKSDYAVYALFFSIQTMIFQASGIGINTGMSAIGGRIWKDKSALGQLVATLSHLRNLIFRWVWLPFMCYCIWLFVKNQISVSHLIFTVIALTVHIWIQIQANLLSDLTRLLSLLKIQVIADLILPAVKFGGIIIAFSLSFLNFYSALIVGVLALWVQLIFLRSKTADLYMRHSDINAGFQREVISFIKPDAINAFYFLFQGQITVVLLTIFTDLNEIANVTAVGRIAIMLAVINTTINGLAMPAVAKTQDLRKLRKLFSLILVIYVLILGTVLFCTYAFPESILWIIGDQYKGLREILFISMLGTCFSQLVGFMWNFISTNGWVKYHWLYTPLTILNQIILFAFLDLHDVNNIVWFGGLSNIGFLVVNCFSLFMGLSGKGAKPAV
jgi:O-antigen/teichoic acid export membrane protein